MKPHIYLRRSIWVCRIHTFDYLAKGPLSGRSISVIYATGHGYTPAQAYADWIAQVKPA